MKILSVFFILMLSASSFAIDRNCGIPDDLEINSQDVNIKETSILSSNYIPRVYYNNTVSHLGFVNEKLDNETEISYNYKKVSTWIDSVLEEMFDQKIEYSFFRGSEFDYQINSQTRSEFKDRVNNPEFYSCKGKIECQKVKTGLSDLSRDILSIGLTKDNNFTVIVSDLFIDEQEIGGNNSAIQKLFEDTFKNNKSIGVYGIKSKFNGNMYNIPGFQIYDKALQRPFFIITIGDKEHVLEFKDLIDRDALKSVKKEDKNFTIFTSDLILNPINPKNIDNELFKLNYTITNGIDRWDTDDGIKKITLSRRKSDPINISFDLESIQLPNSILLQNFEIEINIWKYKENPCWKKTKSKDIATLIQNGNMIEIDLFGKERLKPIKPNEKYFLNFKIYANDLGVSEEDFWMANWNLDNSDINKITTSGETNFPVLNLLKLMRKLDDIQTDEFKRSDRPKSMPIEFNLAIEVTK